VRILLLAQFFPPDIGGEERHVYNLSGALAARGHHVAVATHHVEGLPSAEILPTGVKIYRFRTTAMRLSGVYTAERQHHMPFPDPLGTRNLAKIVELEHPDVVHAHNWIVNSVLPLRTFSPGPGFGLVLTLHDYSNSCATKRMMRRGSPCAGPKPVSCVRCAMSHYRPAVGVVTAAATAAMRPWKERSIDHIVCVSRAVADGNGLAEGRSVSVIPNFVAEDALRSAASDPAGPSGSSGPDELPEGDFLLFVGDLSRDKGVPVLLRAYEALGPGRPPLVLVGKRTPETPATLPPGAEIHYGWPHEAVLAAFRRATVAVLPSVWPDPCPTTVLEAMAAGRPVITTSTGGMVDMVVDGRSGLLVRPGDESALRSAMENLLRDPDLGRRLGQEARRQVEAFTVSSVAGRLEEIYRRVGRGRPVEAAPVSSGRAGL
jgi:glycosyltransferase involved in cell wall biosynthesis